MAAMFDFPTAEPMVLAGQPQALWGELHLRNPGDERVVVREAKLDFASETRAAGLPSTLARVPTLVVHPNQRRQVTLALSIDPYTPPGEYRGQLEIAGERHPVVVHVTENVHLEIMPDELVLPNQPGATFSKRVVLSNRGNVPLNLDDPGAVALDDEFLQCRVLRGALAALGENQRLEDYAAAIAGQARKLLQQAGFLRVRLRNGRLTLSPGQTQAIDLEIQLPKTLEPRSRYRGTSALYTSNLDFAVVPSWGELGDSIDDSSYRKE